MINCLFLITIVMQIINSNPNNDWEKPEIFRLNKEDAHCTLIPYGNEMDAINAVREKSDYFKSLNGEWKFNAIGSGFQGGLAALCKNFGLNA